MFGLDAATISNNTISFVVKLKEPGVFSLEVYDIVGKRIWKHNVLKSEPGRYRVNWNCDNGNRGVAGNGIYFACFKPKKL